MANSKETNHDVTRSTRPQEEPDVSQNLDTDTRQPWALMTTGHGSGTAVRSIFDKIPTEILRHILDLCFNRFGYNNHVILLRLSQVCQRWRDICISTSSWWGFISINKERLFPLFIERSKSTPLYITIPMDFRHSWSSSKFYYSKHLRLSFQHISRWRFVQLVIVNDCATMLKIALSRGEAAPLLERLELFPGLYSYSRWNNNVSVLDLLFKILSKSIKLQYLHMDSIPLPSISAQEVWSRLTVIRIHNLEHAVLDNIVRLFSKCTSATDIEFGVSSIKNRDLPLFSAGHVEVVTLPQLKRLYLDLDGIDTGAWLQNFNLPQLEDLTMKRIAGEPFDIEKFTQFQIQSQCNLQSFYFSLWERYVDVVAGYLSLFWIQKIPDVTFNVAGHPDFDARRSISRNLYIDGEVKEKIREKIREKTSGGLGWGADIGCS